uniref:Uncharacterized protein n=1 Tax=Triticum urartu TaxID=4572 RepID=A0A8R7PEL6_TRIUA
MRLLLFRRLYSSRPLPGSCGCWELLMPVVGVFWIRTVCLTICAPRLR